MYRRLTTLAILGASLALSTGCRSACNGSRGLFSSHARSETPCQLTSGTRNMEGCFDAISGQPIPCPPMGTSVIPGVTPVPAPVPTTTPRPDELPYPSPSDMIPRPGVPFAPPSPAPGTGDAGHAPKTGVPVKGSKQ